MSSALYEVTFLVHVDTLPGETVCVVGNHTCLGDWSARRAKKLVLQREDDSELWSVSVKLPADGEVKYRYFCCQYFEAEDEGEEPNMIVTRWETNLRPRIFVPKAYCLNAEDCKTSVAEFGRYDGRTSIDKGWLMDQTEVQLYLHSNPLQFWKKRHQDQTYRVKCTPLDLKQKEDYFPADEAEESCDFNFHAGKTLMEVSVLNGRFEDSDTKTQDQFGAVYRDKDFLIFKAQTIETEYLGFCLDFYVHDENQGPGDIPKHVGFAHILPNIFQETIGSKTVPLSGLKHKPIGQVSFQYLVIKPMKSYDMNMAVSYSRHWKSQRRALDVGHRGMGPSYSKKLAAVRENTLASLAEAGAHGADFVEFDVQLSKDHVPVIYHDLRVCLSLKKKHGKEIDYFHIPVRELSLEQLQGLKLRHPEEVKKAAPASDHDMESVDPAEHQPFPTLKHAFETLDEHIGFNIEVKYAMQLKTGTFEEDQVHYTERNHYIDDILRCILDHAGSRRIILSCFDPNVCTMLRKKQNKYPVLFLTMGETELWEPYHDKRTLSIPQASEFSLFEEFLGVNVHSEDLLKCPELVKQVKDAGLVLFCWGEDNNNSNNIAYLKQLGVDGLIYDRISDYKPTKENVFKMEKEAKLKLLQDVGVIKSTGVQSGTESGSSSPEHSNNGSPLQADQQGKLTRLSSLQETSTQNDRASPRRTYSVTSQRNV